MGSVECSAKAVPKPQKQPRMGQRSGNSPSLQHRLCVVSLHDWEDGAIDGGLHSLHGRGDKLDGQPGSQPSSRAVRPCSRVTEQADHWPSSVCADHKRGRNQATIHTPTPAHAATIHPSLQPQSQSTQPKVPEPFPQEPDPRVLVHRPRLSCRGRKEERATGRGDGLQQQFLSPRHKQRREIRCAISCQRCWCAGLCRLQADDG